MTAEQLEKLKYPIGKFIMPNEFNHEIIRNLIKEIKQFPELLKETANNLSEEQINTPYRPDGWTIRQVIHHLADSHMNAFIRYKLALTEDNPTIKAYSQQAFADTAESINSPIQSSIQILEGIHQRWSILLESMDDNDFEKTYYHPEYEKTYILQNVLALYAWHGKHHLAHIKHAIAH